MVTRNTYTVHCLATLPVFSFNSVRSSVPTTSTALISSGGRPASRWLLRNAVVLAVLLSPPAVAPPPLALLPAAAAAHSAMSTSQASRSASVAHNATNDFSLLRSSMPGKADEEEEEAEAEDADALDALKLAMAFCAMPPLWGSNMQGNALERRGEEEGKDKTD